MIKVDNTNNIIRNECNRINFRKNIFSTPVLYYKSRNTSTENRGDMDIFKNFKVQKAATPEIEKSFVGSKIDFFSANASSTGVEASEIIRYPYVFHWLVFSVCRDIMLNICKIKWILKNKKSDEPVEEHEILDRIADPSPMFDEQTFKEAIVLGLLLPSGPTEKDYGGQVFIVGRDKPNGPPVDFRRGDIPEMFEFYYERGVDYTFAADVDKTTRAFLGWELKRGADIQRFKHTEVIRINFFNPLDLTRGLSWYTPAYNKIYQDIQSDVYNTEMFENDGTVAGLLHTKEVVGDDQLNQLYRSWRNRHTGVGKNGKVAVLNGNVEYQQFGVKPADMQFKDQKKMGLESVLAVFGLNKIAVGMYEDINLATIREGRRMLYEDTYIPIANKILSCLVGQWIRFVDKNLTLELDETSIRYLREDYTAQAPVYKTLVDTGVPPAMAAEIVGIPFTEENIELYPWLAEDSRPVSPAMNPDGTEEDPDDEEDKPAKKPKDPKEDEDDDDAAKYIKLKSWMKKKTPEEKKKFAGDYVEKTIKPYEQRLEIKLNAYLDDLKDIMVRNVNQFYTNKGILPEVGISMTDIMFSMFGANQKLKEIFKPFYKDVMQAQKRQLSEETSGAINWNLPDSKINKFVKLRDKYIADINKTTFDKVHGDVSKIIEQSLAQSLTVPEMKQKIIDAIGDSITARGGNIGTIVRTETNSIASMSRVDAFKEQDIEWVEWSAYHDDVTRDTHLEANESEPIRMGDKFPGVGLRWPLDPDGPLEEIINCRCVLLASEKNLE